MKLSLKIKKMVVVTGLAVSVASVLWITLFSRVGNETRHFYPPFCSYKVIACGSTEALFEVIGNIILFIPIGFLATIILHTNLCQTVILGFAASLLIESCQWFFWLGAFEVDDIFHNTIGVALGVVVIKKTFGGQRIKSLSFNQKRSIFSLIVVTLLFILVMIGSLVLKKRMMVRYAALNDRADGTKNLLVLSPVPKYIVETDFSVSYNSDGTILIRGSSEKRAWIEIGRFVLSSGKYIFSGLSGVPEKTVAIELECFNEEQGKYSRLTHDVGPIDAETFELNEETKLRILVGIYAGAKGEYLAHPAVYRED